MTIDWGVALRVGAIVLPTALGVFGLWAAFEMPEIKKTSTKWALRIALLVFGVVTSVIVYLQQDYDRREASREQEAAIQDFKKSQSAQFSKLEVGITDIGGKIKQPQGTASVPLAAPKPIAADVTMRFVSPGSPALVLSNNSGVTASQIKWMVVLFNMDDPRSYFQYPADMPKVHDALPIPVQTFDFINAHQTGGPEGIFTNVMQYVKKGQHLVGSAGVICPTCAHGHTYILSVTYGEGGWYYEVPRMKSGGSILPKSLTPDSVAEYAKTLEASVPQKDRIPIKPE